MQSKCNAMLGSWLSAAMSCYLRAVETREREAGGCVMWLDSAQKWPVTPSGQWLQWLWPPDCTHLANQRLQLETNDQSEAGKSAQHRYSLMCVTISLTQGTPRLRPRKFVTIYYACVIKLWYCHISGVLRTSQTFLHKSAWSVPGSQVTPRIISGVSGECFERWGPFPSVSEYTKENWPTAYTTCNANVHSYTLLFRFKVSHQIIE